jgi:hypothetical protein
MYSIYGILKILTIYTHFYRVGVFRNEKKKESYINV